MAAYIKYYQFVEDLCKGEHNFTDDTTCTVTVALSNTAGDIAQTEAILTDIVEISYTNLSARVITGITCEQTTGTVHLTANNLVLTASGAVATFQYVILYNDDTTTPADALICAYNHGSTVTLANGETYTISFSSDIFTLA